jgi:ParB-like chromosome segregation protein Spo0J
MTTNWLEILRHYPEIAGIHPAADLFPMVEGDEFAELCNDIKERGLAQPITIWTDGSLLDGRNRLLACYETHQEVVLDRYEGTDPVQFSLSANLHRRHLSAGQRACVCVEGAGTVAASGKERQREAGEQFGKGAKVTADLRSMEPASEATGQKATAPDLAERAARIATWLPKPPRPLVPALAQLSRLLASKSQLLIYYLKCKLAPWH